jgi:hypothetical protein
MASLHGINVMPVDCLKLDVWLIFCGEQIDNRFEVSYTTLIFEQQIGFYA